MLGAKIKGEFEAEAEARMMAGVSPVANLPQGDTGKSRDQAAAVVNVSPRLVESAVKVRKNGAPGLAEMGDAGAFSFRLGWVGGDREPGIAGGKIVLNH